MVGSRLALFYVHQMNRVNSCNDLVVMMTAVKISSWVVGFIIIIIIIYTLGIKDPFPGYGKKLEENCRSDH